MCKFYDVEDGVYKEVFDVNGICYLFKADITMCSTNFIVLSVEVCDKRRFTYNTCICYLYNLKEDKYTSKYEYDNAYKVLAGYSSIGRDRSGDEVFVYTANYETDSLFDSYIRKFVYSIKDELIGNILIG